MRPSIILNLVQNLFSRKTENIQMQPKDVVSILSGTLNKKKSPEGIPNQDCICKFTWLKLLTSFDYLRNRTRTFDQLNWW